jgi:hypothetical protein
MFSGSSGHQDHRAEDHYDDADDDVGLEAGLAAVADRSGELKSAVDRIGLRTDVSFGGCDLVSISLL